MFETLEQIDWSKLYHAHGSARDLPDLIRNLNAKKPAQRERALNELCERITHQETVYNATPLVVPFLIELLAARDESRPGILTTLAWLAQGTGEEADVRATWLAVTEGTPIYLRLLGDPARDVRVMVPLLLARCVNRLAEVEAGFIGALAQAAEPGFTASALIGLTRLWVGQGAASDTDAARRGEFLARWLDAGAPAIVRFVAALGLTELGAQARYPHCLGVLRESAGAGLADFPDPPWERHQAVQGLSKVLDAAPELRRQLLAELFQNADINIRFSAMYQAEAVCREERGANLYFAPFYGELLRDADERICEQACHILSRLGSAPALVVEPILDVAAGAKSAYVRSLALRMLGKLGETRSIPILLAMLDDPTTRLEALCTLESFEGLGPQLAGCVPAVRQQLGAQLEIYQRTTAVRILGCIGPAAREATPDLIAQLDSPDDFVRKHAAKSLWQIGPDGAAAVPALTARLDDKDPRVRAAVALALWQIDQQLEAATRTLLAILQRNYFSPMPATYWSCVEAAENLVLLQTPIPAAPPLLRKMLAPGSSDLSVRAAWALWRMEGRADEVLPVLVGALSRTPAGLLALQCLEEMGPLAAPAVPELRKCLEPERVVNDFNDMNLVIEHDETFRAVAKRILARFDHSQ